MANISKTWSATLNNKIRDKFISLRLAGFQPAVLVLALFLILVAGPRASGQTMIEPHAQAMPLLPFLDYLADQSLGMDIEEAVGSNGWRPLLPDSLPSEEGIIWLRFTIAPLAANARAQTFLLDLGQSVPGTAALFDPVRNELSGAQEWRENLPSERNILLLPEATATAIPCYIRLEGLPGPWFAPMIRTPQNAASNWSSLAHAASVLALGVIMALCLLRGLMETGQWRYWVALFVGTALLQTWLGMPAITDGFSLAELLAILTPGLALMMLPHAGRHLMQARKYSRPIDIQLFLLSFPGAALAILPLIPGWDWLNRWLDLWPLATLIFIPTALAAWLGAIPGARRFLLACVIPPIFTAIAWFGLDFGLPANVLASGPAWGIFCAALILVATISPAVAPAAKPAKEKQGKKTPEIKKLPEMPELAPEQDEILNLEHPLDDPNLRIIPPDSAAPAQAVCEAPPRIPPSGGTELELREIALRKPLDDLLREGSSLEKCALPPSARKNVEQLMDAADRMAAILSNIPRTPKRQASSQGRFNLQHVLRNAHDSVAPSAEYAGIALSWYMPPHLPQNYEGDGQALENTLAMLLESSVRSTRHGAIKVSATRTPDSPDPGHILFTVTDNGNGFPPLERSSLALAYAWELTGRCGGYLSMESSQHGATISFTAHFKPTDEEAEIAGNAPRVLLLSDDGEDTRNLVRIIEPLACNLIHAQSTQEVIAAQTDDPYALLITSGRFSRPASADMARQFTRLARDKGIAPHILAITQNANEWHLLKASGFTHAMLEPVDPEILRNTIAKLATPAPGGGQAAKPVNGQSASLFASDAIKSDEAPSMLIEQSFPIAQAFEGPEWLGHSDEEDEAQDAAPPEKQPEPVPDKAPETATEWVGEPQPIQKPAQPASSAAAKPAAKAAPKAETVQSHAPADAVEWVGEPTPVVKKPEKQPEPIAPAPAAAEPEEGELLDFIMDAKERKQPEEKKEAAASQVKDFMESSINLVTSTLTGMLRQENKAEKPRPALAQPRSDSGKPKPVADTQPRPDPDMAALLGRMDKAMQIANKAYETKNCAAIAESTGLIARDAEKFGLRLLARMANCVERAAAANDMAALADLLPELGIAVERNRITLAAKKSG